MSDDRDPAERVHQIGSHAITMEGDILLARFRGGCTLSEAREFTAHVDGLTAGRRPVFAVLDMREATGPSPEARAWLGQWGEYVKVHGVAVFGASAPVRIILTLLNNATRLMFRRTQPIRFCRDEDEARSWAAEQHSKLSSKASS